MSEITDPAADPAAERAETGPAEGWQDEPVTSLHLSDNSCCTDEENEKIGCGFTSGPYTDFDGSRAWADCPQEAVWMLEFDGGNPVGSCHEHKAALIAELENHDGKREVSARRLVPESALHVESMPAVTPEDARDAINGALVEEFSATITLKFRGPLVSREQAHEILAGALAVAFEGDYPDEIDLENWTLESSVDTEQHGA